MSTYTTDPRALRLREFLAAYVSRYPNWAYEQHQLTWISRLRAADEVGAEIVDLVGFREVQLTSLLDNPDGELIRQVVSWVMPFPYGQEFDLMVAAVEHAANADVRRRRGEVVAWTTVAVATLVLFAWSWNS